MRKCLRQVGQRWMTTPFQLVGVRDVVEGEVDAVF